MLYAYHCNQLDVLHGMLAHHLKKDSPSNPLLAETVLIQSQGMAQWLKLALSQSLGLCANIHFSMPANFIWQLLNQLNPNLPNQSNFSKDALTLKIYHLLETKQHEPNYAPIKHYLDADKDGLGRYQLSAKIADLFDQYLVYRPDWLLAWEQGRAVEVAADKHQIWQQDLWRTLLDYSQSLGQSEQHRARLFADLQQPEIQPQLQQLIQQQRLSKRLFVFAISAMPASYWHVLQGLSQVLDVHYFVLNPCQNYWQDLPSYRVQLKQLQAGKNPSLNHDEFVDYYDVGNPLLSAWGKVGRDFLALMHQSPIQDIAAWVEPSAAHLLAQIQTDILNLNNRQVGFSNLTYSRDKTPISADDDSLTFVNAHNELREVQHLHDRLWHWFEQDPELQPKDVLVMVPDIDRYAPFVNAVFASAQTAQQSPSRYIPWSISDQSINAQAPLLQALLALINLPHSRFSLQEILDWLSIDAIAAKFQLGTQDVLQIQLWLEQAQVRWGLDGKQRVRIGAPDFAQNSWIKGIRQLLLGYVSDNTQTALAGDWALPALEGQDADIANGLIAFLTRLQDWCERLAKPQVAPQWLGLINSLIDDLFLPNEQEAQSLQFVRDELHTWQQTMLANQFNEPLAQPIIYAKVNQICQQQGSWQRFLTGKVNICTLMPMRAIPFKIICLLGMNDSGYPRKDMPVSFDLMRIQPQAGDRSPAQDDRYLFLEAICSAQQKLYISHRGRDKQKNTLQQPAVVVNELLDYIGNSFCLETDSNLNQQQSEQALKLQLTTQLPLQPFAPANFTQHYPSFDNLWWQIAQQQISHIEVNEPFIHTPLALPEYLLRRQIALEDMALAYQDSAQFFFSRRLNLPKLNDIKGLLDSEPFALEKLDLYQLKADYLRAIEQAENAQPVQFLERNQALGRVSFGQAGVREVQSMIHTMEPLQRFYQQTMHAKEAQSWHGEISVLDTTQGIEVQISADISPIYEHQLIQLQVGSLKGSQVLKMWLTLCALAVAQTDEPVLASLTQAKIVTMQAQKQVSCLTLSMPSVALATAQLRQALAFYWQCWQKPPMYFADSIWQVLNSKNPDAQWDNEKKSEFAAFYNAPNQRLFAGQIEAFFKLTQSEKMQTFEDYDLLAHAFAHSQHEVLDGNA